MTMLNKATWRLSSSLGPRDLTGTVREQGKDRQIDRQINWSQMGYAEERTVTQTHRQINWNQTQLCSL